MQGTLRRNRIGTKAANLWNWQVEDIKKMTGPLAVQQYIQQLIRNDPSAINKIIECPSQIDFNQWKYEQLRQFVLQLNLLVTSLKDICTNQTCPTMKGSQESQYLCTAHKQGINCCAIDYMCHNLDQSTSILLNIKNYGNRLGIGQTKSLDTIFRRLYRIFSHTYFFHKEVYESFQRFLTFGLKYNLIQENMINIPKTAFMSK